MKTYADLMPRIPGDEPVQPRSTDMQDQKDPLFRKYCAYRAAMASQLVTAMPFASWREQYLDEQDNCLFD